MKKMFYAGLLVLAASFPTLAASSDDANETTLMSSQRIEPYLSGIAHHNDETEYTFGSVSHGVKIVKEADGSCYKETVTLHSIDKLPTSVPGEVVYGPNVTSIKENSSCDVKKIAQAAGFELSVNFHHKLTSKPVSHGVKIVKLADGTCYKETNEVYSMEKVETSIPDQFIYAPSFMSTTGVVGECDAEKFSV